MTDSFKTIPAKRGLYAPNPRRQQRRLAASGDTPSPRLVAVNGGR
jgi:hypothetical protein